jgi:signal transduction histidine kinase
MRKGSRVVIEDTETDALFAPYRAAARAADFRAVVSTPLIGADGRTMGMVSTHFRSAQLPADQDLRRLDLYLRLATDYIQRCKMEQRLQKSEEALRDADRRKDEFLALLAHELRNPLAPIRYALATAKKSDRTVEQKRRAEEVIERQVDHMSHLLDDLLDVSRITHGTLELLIGREAAPLDAGVAGRGCVARCRPGALGPGIFQSSDQCSEIHRPGWTHRAQGCARGRYRGRSGTR